MYHYYYYYYYYYYYLLLLLLLLLLIFKFFWGLKLKLKTGAGVVNLRCLVCLEMSHEKQLRYNVELRLKFSEIENGILQNRQRL